MYIWLVVWNIFYFPILIGNVIIPTDFLIFQRGGEIRHQPDINHYKSPLITINHH